MCKRTLFWLVIALSMILAACSPAGLKPTPGPKAEPTSAQPSPGGGLQARPQFLEQLRSQLARQQGVSVDQVIIEEYQSAQWPDACLGLAKKDEVCAQTITPGYLVVVSLPSGTLELHTDKSGLNYRQTTLESPPGERPVAVIWQRSGGFAGICQRLIVYLDGGYRLINCVKEQVLGEGKLADADLAKLQKLQGQYTDFRWQSVPPSGSADMFTEELSFNGAGSTNLPKEEQQQLAEYVAQLAGSLLRAGASSTP